MKKVVFVMLFFISRSYGQDPSFSQFFSSPLNVNPALTGNINADWRFISNVRDQWIGPASPYVTGSISYDRKVLQNKYPGVQEGNVLGVGGMILFDNAMGGIAKSLWASLDMAYQIRLINGETQHAISVGYGVCYGQRTVDFQRLDWEEQFTGYGFNTNLPTGEVALSNMKPYLSLSAGLTYTMRTTKSNLDLGIAAFHLNKPHQTFLNNDNQLLAIRKVGHANFETFLNDRMVLNVNGIYQFQDQANYISAGGALGYFLTTDQNASMLNAGIWYWSKNAIVSYIGIAYKDMQFGMSYDLTISKLTQATKKPNTFELSVIIRGTKRPSGIIPCPWK